MGLAFFDADGTLFPNPSSESRFIRQLLAEGRLGPPQYFQALWFMLRAWPCYGRHTGRKNKAYLSGLREAEMAALGRRFVAQRLRPLLRPALLERIEMHRRRGDRLVLLTGTPWFIAEPLGEHLGMDEVCATRPASDGERFLAAPPFIHPLGMEKLDLARRIGERLDIPPHRWSAYGDSRYDLPLLRHCAAPVAVTPDPVLMQAARAAGWEIIAASALALSEG